MNYFAHLINDSTFSYGYICHLVTEDSFKRGERVLIYFPNGRAILCKVSKNKKFDRVPPTYAKPAGEADGYRCFKANLHSRRAKMFYIINKYNFYEGG